MTSASRCSSTSSTATPIPTSATSSTSAATRCIAIGLVMLLRTRGTSRDAGGVIDGFIVATSVGVLLWVFFVQPPPSTTRLPLFEQVDQRCLPCRRSAADRDRRATGGSPSQATGAVLDLGRQSARTARRRSRLPLSISVRRLQRTRPGRLRLVDQLRPDRRGAVAPAGRRNRCRAEPVDAEPVAAVAFSCCRSSPSPRR